MAKVMSYQGFFKMPLAVLRDDRLYATDKVLLAAMIAYTGKSLRCTKSISKLAELSGLSARTVAEGIQRLQERNILREIRRYRQLPTIGRKGYAAFVREICVDLDTKKCISIPRELFAYLRRDMITPTATVIYMALHGFAGRQKRSYASLQHIAAATRCALSTVKESLKKLTRCGLIARNRCMKANHAYTSSNTYIVYQRLAPAQKRAAVRAAQSYLPWNPESVHTQEILVKGRPIFATLLVKSKLTGTYIKTKDILISILDSLRYIEGNLQAVCIPPPVPLWDISVPDAGYAYHGHLPPELAESG